jgi:hypothetical protein
MSDDTFHFEQHTLENLKVLRVALKSYLQGVEDTQKLMDDLWKKSVELYNHKLYLCDEAIKSKQTPDNKPGVNQ